jgi:UPF0716 protein FxsA
MSKLLLALLLLPPIDLYVLVRVGRAFGGEYALLSVLVSGLLGSVIARTVGLRQLRDWRCAMAEGRTPGQGVVDGLLLLVACLFLIVPGPVSDGLALALFIPPLRSALGDWLQGRVRRAIDQGMLHVTQVATAQPFVDMPYREPPRGEGDVIDVEGEVVQPPTAAEPDPRKRLSS